MSARPKQQAILAYRGGRMAVSAVPGSGKTWTLAALAAELIASDRLRDDQEVLIVTLVNSAVDNFSQRVRAHLKERGLESLAVQCQVRTLHGLAHDIVRARPALVGLDDNFVIVDEQESANLLTQAAERWVRQHAQALHTLYKPEVDDRYRDWLEKTQLPDRVVEWAGACLRYAKDRQLTPADLHARLAGRALLLAEMAASVYEDYQGQLAYRGAVDFDDLNRLAVRALQADPALLARLQNRWPFVLEDEAQDSSRLQETLLRLLTAQHDHWVRVGDPNQAIYATFTTASPEHLRQFMLEPEVQARDLPNSGRSTPSIIALANLLIGWTQNQHPVREVRQALAPPLIEPAPPGDPQGNPPDAPDRVHIVTQAYSPEKELDVVAESLKRWLPHHPERTVAVLAPRNMRAFAMAETLKKHGLPVVDALLRSSDTTRRTVGSLTRVLRALGDPGRPQWLAETLEVWQRDHRDDQAHWALVQRAAKTLKTCTQLEAFIQPGPTDWLETVRADEAVFDLLHQFRARVARWHRATLLPIDQLVLTLAHDLFTDSTDWAVAHKVALTLRRAARVNPHWQLTQFNDELAAIAKNERKFVGFGEADTGFTPDAFPGQVVVATLHRAKGLEWDRVHLISMNGYDFPSAQNYDKYQGEPTYIRDQLNPQAEALAQVQAALDDTPYHEGPATQAARLEYTRERLRLLYVGLTRARRELIITTNSGRDGDQALALPLVALAAEWEKRRAVTP